MSKQKFVATSKSIPDIEEQFNLLNIQKVEYKQLEIGVAAQNRVSSAKFFHYKPQIVSVPKISPKVRDRYRVVLGNQILGDRLTIDEAIALSKFVNKSNNPSHS